MLAAKNSKRFIVKPNIRTDLQSGGSSRGINYAQLELSDISA